MRGYLRKVVIVASLIVVGYLCGWMHPSQPLPIVFEVSTPNPVGFCKNFPVRIEVGSSTFYPKVRMKVYAEAFTDVIDGKDSDVAFSGVETAYIYTQKGGPRFHDINICFSQPNGEYLINFELYNERNSLISSRQLCFIIENNIAYSGGHFHGCLFDICKKNIIKDIRSSLTAEERKAVKLELYRIERKRMEISEQRKKN